MVKIGKCKNGKTEDVRWDNGMQVDVEENHQKSDFRNSERNKKETETNRKRV